MLLRRAAHYVLTYQSHGLGFSEWVNLFTLCLAPLIAHVLVGAPDPVITRKEQPPWADRICFYNPTSIVWRYFVITDRRVRTREWTADDMVAANSVLWTDSGWHNPTQLRKIPGKHASFSLPRKGRISLLSASALKTLLVALQGIQAVYLLSEYLAKGKHLLSMTTIFLPIAVLGLLRLPAAPWLFDESGCFHNISYALEPAEATDPLLVEESEKVDEDRERMLPQSSVWAVFTRVYFLLCLMVALTLALINFSLPFYLASKAAEEQSWPATLLLNSFFYCFLAALTTIVTFGYIVTGKTESTVIPCLSSGWYKLYTFLLCVLGVAMIVVSAIETRRSARGDYTVYSHAYDRTTS